MKHLFSLLFLFLAAQAFAQTGTITGLVRSADGQPGEYVNVELKGTRKIAVADKNGHFTLRNIEAGTYTLVATFSGLRPQERAVTVTNGQTVTVDFILTESASELEQVIVSANVKNYNEKTPSASLRVTTPLLELPQNVQVVTKDMLRDQQIISMSDGLIRNVSGLVRSEHWADLYTNITARGSQIQALRNGLNVVSSYWGPLTEDAAIVDHIEFVKGPAGFLISSGNPSGAYNVVTKKPTGQNRAEASLIAGSFDLYRAGLDLDGKLSKDGRLLYRLNLAAQNKNSFRPNEFNDRYVVAPVISYQLDDATKLTFEYTYQRANMSNVGSYYVFSPNRFAELPRNFTMLPGGLDPTVINDHSFFGLLNHDFDDNWKLTVQLSRFNSDGTGASAWPWQVNSNYTAIRGISSWQSKSWMNLGQAFVNGDVQTGAVRHRILGGIDAANKNYLADWGQGHALDTTGGEFNLLNPNLGRPPNGYPRFDFTTTSLEERAYSQGGVIKQNYAALYLQDELGFLDNKIRLTLAGRYTEIAQSYNSPDVKASHFTPRVGLSVSVNNSLSVYALYDQAFTPQTGILANGGKVQPITGNNMEAGVKKDWMDGRWSTSLTAYRILTNNELTADPNSPPTQGLSIELGQKRAQGLEFDLHGSPVRGMNLVLNYAFTDSKVIEVAPGVTTVKVGQIVPGYATHTANAWMSYKLSSGKLQGLGFNLGATFLGDRNTYWDTPPAGGDQLKDYLKTDAGIFWERGRMRIAANVFNVLDEYLYSGSWYSWLNAYYTQAEAPRNLRLSLNYRF